jgi:hypothetical protein
VVEPVRGAVDVEAGAGCREQDEPASTTATTETEPVAAVPRRPSEKPAMLGSPVANPWYAWRSAMAESRAAAATIQAFAYGSVMKK